jgi:hypothetical protein
LAVLSAAEALPGWLLARSASVLPRIDSALPAAAGHRDRPESRLAGDVQRKVAQARASGRAEDATKVGFDVGSVRLDTHTADPCVSRRSRKE